MEKTLLESETNSIIVTILSQEYPLSSAAILKRLKYRYKKLISIQAVHKDIQRLKKIGILEQEGKYYKLSINWLNKHKEFFESTQLAYTSLHGRLEFPV